MKNFTVRLEDDMRELLKRSADAAGMSEADYVRRLISQGGAGQTQCDARRYRAKRKPRAGRTHGDAGRPHGAVVELLASQMAEKDRQIKALESALRESMAATAEALKTAQAAQAIQAASRPGLVERIRGFFSREISGT